MKSPPRNPTHQELSNSTRVCSNFLIYIWFCWLVLEICSIFNNSWTAKCKHHQTTTSVHLYSLKASQWYKGTTKSNIFAHEVWEISTWQKNNTIETNKLLSSDKTMRTNKLPSFDILSYSWKVIDFKGSIQVFKCI
jgi:hypothetical protein